MNKFKLLITLFFISVLAMAQVGIETDNPGSNLEVNGSLGINYTQITSGNYNLTNTDYYVRYEGTNDATFTLPDGTSSICNCEGRTYEIINKTNNQKITLNAFTGQQIDAVASVEIPAGYTLKIVNRDLGSGGSYWTTAVYASANPFTEDEGVLVFKTRLQLASGFPVLNAGDFSFFYSSSTNGDVFKIKFNGTGTRNIDVFVLENWVPGTGWGYYTSSGTNTLTNTGMPSDWTQVGGSTAIGASNELNSFKIYDSTTGKIYRFEGNLLLIGGQYYIAMACEVF